MKCQAEDRVVDSTPYHMAEYNIMFENMRQLQEVTVKKLKLAENKIELLEANKQEDGSLEKLRRMEETVQLLRTANRNLHARVEQMEPTQKPEEGPMVETDKLVGVTQLKFLQD